MYNKPNKLFTKSSFILTGALAVFLFASVGTYLIFFSKAASSSDADFDGNNIVNITDLSILASNWGKSNVTQAQGDANGDNTVNIQDLSILASYWGQTVTPMPTGQPANSINVKDYGAKGDGVSDDTANLTAAFNAAVLQNKTAWVPSGTYYLGSYLTAPDGLVAQGSGMESGKTWIKGRVEFGSNSNYSDIKIGTKGLTAVHPKNINVHDVTFQRVQFRGGGGAFGSNNSVVALIGNDRNGNFQNLYFYDCNFERNLGVNDPAKNHSERYNTVSIGPNSVAPSIDNILFKGCHFGVDNGETGIGSPSFHVETWTDNQADTPGSGKLHNHGYANINFEDNIFEAPDDETIDYAGAFDDAAFANGQLKPINGPCHITGNTFKGNGKDFVWNSDIVTETGAGYLTIENNTFYRGAGTAFAAGRGHFGLVDETLLPQYNVFRNNTIDATNNVLNTGITHASYEYVALNDSYNTVTNNTILTNLDQKPAISINGHHNTVTNNNITIQGYIAIDIMSGANYNNVTLNVLKGWTYKAVRDQSGVLDNTITPNY